MSGTVDHETMYVDELPGIWSPVQWELTEEERAHEIEEQARASLLWAVDAPETVLRLLLRETEIVRAYEPPQGYDEELQGEWDASIVTFQFRRPIRLERVDRGAGRLSIIYDFHEMGYWSLSIEPERVLIERL